MSGDIKNRRKDKKRRKDGAGNEPPAELLKRFSISTDDEDVKEPAAAPTLTSKQMSEDIQMHLQSDGHGTGGHWCAKIVFFILMAILGGLIVLIILENRGMSDVDTPLSESRYQQLFDGWVDESREQHDDHPVHGGDDDEHEDDELHDHEILEGLNELDSHEHDEEAFAEEPADDDDEADEVEELVPEDDEPVSAENVSAENLSAEMAQSDEQVVEDDAPERISVLASNEDDAEQQDAPAVDSVEMRDSFENDMPYEEFEDDGGSMEQMVENDSGEELFLQKLAEKAAEKATSAEEPIVQESSMAVKLIVGLALLVVAYLVLVRKYKTNDPEAAEKSCERKTMTTDESVVNEDRIAKRRQTLISREEACAMEEVDNLESDLIQGEEDEEILEEGDFEDDEEEIYSGDELEGDDLDGGEPRDKGPLEAEPQVDEELYDNFVEDEESVVVEHITLPQKLTELNTAINRSTDEPKVKATEPVELKVEAPKNEPDIPEIPATPEPTSEEILDDDEGPYDEDLEYVEGEEYYEEEEDELDENMEGDEEIGEDEIDDDVEYEEESEIEDVDDSELMKRLEQKYGRIEKETTEYTPTDNSRGPQSIEDEDANDSYLNIELRRAESLLEDKPVSALKVFERLLLKHPKSVLALYGKAKALDQLSTVERSNQLLLEAIDEYRRVLNSDQANDTMFVEVAELCLKRMRFLGQHVKAIEVHNKLIHRFPELPNYRNQLAITYLLMNRLADAKRVLHETLLRWRHNGFALVHYGFVLKNLDQNYEKSVDYFREGIASQEPGTQDGRFYFHWGDALARLGRKAEAMEVYEAGARKKLFLSKYQRSLYNVDRLKSQPFWTVAQTTYASNLNELKSNWRQIRNEALKILNEDGVFQNEAESLKAAGDWKQFELFARGQRVHRNCAQTPFTCSLIEKFPAARRCKRGQVKFSVMQPGTKVWSHCGPTNCRIRAHLGLVVPPGPYLTVAEQTRTWKEGEWLIFDDSFEHEVHHNGTSTRLVLIVDVWHPDLTLQEQNTLTPI